MPDYTPGEQAAYALKPLAIQPTTDGYLLRENARRLTDPKPPHTLLGWIGTVIMTAFFSPLIVTVLALAFGVWLLRPFFRLSSSAIQRHTGRDGEFQAGCFILTVFAGGLLITVLSVFLPSSLVFIIFYIEIYFLLVYILFGTVYWPLRWIVDPKTRQRFAFNSSLDELDITFSHYPLRIGDGDRLTLRRGLKETIWTQLTDINPFTLNSHIEVSLICVERVTYTQGTDSITDLAEVYCQVLETIPVIPGAHQIFCHFDLSIPGHLAPSFEGKHNQIRWLLRVEETYPQAISQLITYFTFVVNP